YGEAVAAFLRAKELFADPDGANDPARARRLDANLADVRIARGEYAEALDHLDAYLASGPAAIEPYRQKVLALKRLGRSAEVVPALRGYAQRLPDHFGLKLLLAEELAA